MADFNGDGHLDIAAINIGEPNAVYLGDGDGSFGPGTVFGADERSYAAAVADLDSDGDLDLVVANVGGPNQVWLNQGDVSHWTRMMLCDDAESTYGAAAADLNGDRFTDIVFANSAALNPSLVHL